MVRLSDSVRAGLSRILTLIFPVRCAVCHASLGTQPRAEHGNPSGGSCLCASCLTKWQAARAVLCPECQKPIMLCRCVTLGDGTVPLYSLLPYRPGSDDPVSRFLLMRKTQLHPAAEDFLAGQVSVLCQCAAAEIGGASDEWILTYPPRSIKKRREVGHDQSEVLAKRLSRLTGIPEMNCLQRVVGADTAQKTLGAAERAENAEDSYRLKDAPAEDIRGKRVILIDDIATTGATLSVCAAHLRQAGASAVVAVTAARTVHQ